MLFKTSLLLIYAYYFTLLLTKFPFGKGKTSDLKFSYKLTQMEIWERGFYTESTEN